MSVSLPGPHLEAPVLISTGQDPVLESHVHLDTSAISEGVPTLGGTVASPPTLHEADTTAKIPNPVHLVNLSTKGKHYPLSTPVNVNSLEKVIDGHPNRTLVNQLCHNLRYGACVGYTGPRVPRFCKNLPTALAQPDIVTSNLAKEVALGRIAGPYDSPPFTNFQVSPIGLVPKKHSSKFRTIFHLSFPKSGATSINHFSSKEDHSLQYITIDNAIKGIQSLGQGCFPAKTDIESAFRLIPLKPKDCELFGICWEGKFYYEKVLPFGLRSAPYIFNQLSDAIEWILVNKCSISSVCHILDDFLIIEPASPLPPHSQICQESLTSMLLSFKSLNIPIATDKTAGPTQAARLFPGKTLPTADDRIDS